jgi:hypothetical protein
VEKGVSQALGTVKVTHSQDTLVHFVLKHGQALYLRLRFSPQSNHRLKFPHSLLARPLPMLLARHRRSLPTHVAAKMAQAQHVWEQNGAHAVLSIRTVAQLPITAENAASWVSATAIPYLHRANNRLALAHRSLPHLASCHPLLPPGQPVPQD